MRGPLIAVASLVECGLWGVWASVVAALGLRSCGCQAVGHSFNSWGHTDLAVCSVWGLPGSGIEPASPVLAGRVFTTEPRGKPPGSYFSISFLAAHRDCCKLIVANVLAILEISSMNNTFFK